MPVIDRNFAGTLERDIEKYPEGITVIIDKPYRWTSADVIRKVKFAATRYFCKRNLKVGHAGTLDPLASGVLLVCIGNACKNAQALQASDKEYLAGICFGATTASYDREKEIDRLYSADGTDRDSLEAILPEFLGEQEQVAPLFSAKMVDGIRAYQLARKMYSEGSRLDDAAAELLTINRINISALKLENFGTSGELIEDHDPASSGASSRINVAAVPPELPCALIRVTCSKGTYIRALARDLGEKMGSGAFLGSLQRSKCGSFTVEDAVSVERAVEILTARIF